MEQLKEVEDVVDDFVANMRYITWKPKQLATLLGDPSYTGPREWFYAEVYAPLDVAQAVADFAAFIAEHPLPHVPHRHRQGAVIREEVVALGKLLHDYMDIVHMLPSQVAYHCKCSPYAVRGWWRGWTTPPWDVVAMLKKWADYIKLYPFPQYRKGTHGGARYRHSVKVKEPLHVSRGSQR
jgi:hypothetical protein